jgi:hypothetical protein
MAYENNIYSIKVSLQVAPVEYPGYGDIPFSQSVITPDLQYRVVSAYEYGGPQFVGVWNTPGVCQVTPLGICQNSPRLYYNYDSTARDYTSFNCEEAEVMCAGISKAIVGSDSQNVSDNSGRTQVNAGDKVRLAFNGYNYNEMGFITYNITGDYHPGHVGVALQYGDVGDIIPVAVNCL